jgi:hypothetical protein
MQIRVYTSTFLVIAATALSGCGSSAGTDTTGSALKSTSSILGQISGHASVSANTVPDNGDVNPYGVAFVPNGFGGILKTGDILVANFNNAGNLQGTGSTVVAVNKNSPATPRVFYELPQPLDLTSDEMGFSTALGVLSNGLVVLGNVPSVGGTGACNAFDSTQVGPGHLTVIGADGLKRTGGNVTSLDGGVDGPWDLTIVPESATKAIIFVANLNVGGGIDHGQVLRKDLTLTVDGGISSVTTTVIAAGYTTRCDSAAFVVGPTGLAYDSSSKTLYVASTGDNAIFEIDNADTAGASNSPGTIVAQDLKQFHGPLGLVLAQNGDLISTQGDAVAPDKTHPSEIVEITGAGTFLSQFSIATTRSFPGKGAGAAFGIALDEGATPGSSRFAAVDDGSNVLDVWSF